MNKILLIIKREYIVRVRKRAFILTTLLAPLSIVLFAGLGVLVNLAGSEEQHILVKDENGYIKIPDQRKLYFKYTDESLSLIKEHYEELGHDGILYIPAFKGQDIFRPRGIRYFSAKQMGMVTQAYIKSKITKKIKDKIIEQEKIDKVLLKKLNINITIDTIELGEGGEKQSYATIATIAGFATGFLIYMILLIYGTMVMKGVIEEKTNRIIEIIISSVKPFQLMVGKIIGLGAVGLTQFMIWLGLFACLQITLSIAIAQYGFGDVSSIVSDQGADKEQMMAALAEYINVLEGYDFKPLIIGMLFYFIGGYLLYAALFAAIGSTASEDGDLQSLTFIVTLPIMTSFFIMTTVIQQPNSSLAFWSSMIPFSSPIVMPARIAFGVPLWEIILSVTLLFLGFMGTTWVAAKIYRTGILMYGKKVSLRELGKWLFYKS